jgi:hypothetical protein
MVFRRKCHAEPKGSSGKSGMRPSSTWNDPPSRKTEAASPEERRVALRLLWKLPDLPKRFAAVLPRWAKDADRQTADLAGRLLDRD